jgi:hypothetical protein
MGYEIHIEREKSHNGSNSHEVITLLEWQSAVQSIKNLRIAPKNDWVGHNPKTGSQITIPGSGADAEVYFPPKPLKGHFKGSWRKVFRWNPRGRISFKSAWDSEDINDPITKAAAEIARCLGAVVVGDEGEEYDLVTKLGQEAV